MEYYFETRDLAVGYNGRILIRDIRLQVEKGKILTLIGPNGAGKSTILKTITKQLRMIHGSVWINGQDISLWNPRQMAKKVAVVLTERVRPELMTCWEVVAMGRYPYTNALGQLTRADRAAVTDALSRVHGLDLADQDFATLSDGQRQRILLARAICQEPEVLVLDEPTAYLDIRHKIELLDILREMAREKVTTVIMSLHEIDLATKISDYLVCVKGDTIAGFGPPETILQAGTIASLYDMEQGSYDLRFGSVELAKPEGCPKAFVIGGNGTGIPVYRQLQKRQIPFAAGILPENDMDVPVAEALGTVVITAPAFEPMTDEHYIAGAEVLKNCTMVINSGAPRGTMNAENRRLLTLAEKLGIPIYEKEALPWNP